MTEYEYDAYNAILYHVYETAEFAQGTGGDTSTETIRRWCNGVNRTYGLNPEIIDEVILEIEARLSPRPNPKLLNIMARGL